MSHFVKSVCDQASQRIKQHIRLNRLGEMRIHACLQAALHVFVKCICGMMKNSYRNKMLYITLILPLNERNML